MVADVVAFWDDDDDVMNEGVLGADEELCNASFLPPSSALVTAFALADNFGI